MLPKYYIEIKDKNLQMRGLNFFTHFLFEIFIIFKMNFLIK